MKKRIPENSQTGNALSPILFTQTQKSLKKRKSSKDETSSTNGKTRRNETPYTPGLAALLQSPGLPEGAHGYSSSKRLQDDSFLNKIFNNNASDTSTFRSSQGRSHWLFDTPSESKDSPVTRKHKGVSRRSLDKLIDPEISNGWVESMATPPSDTSDKLVNVSTTSGENDTSLSPAITTSNRTQNDRENTVQLKRSVARVLFLQENCSNADKEVVVHEGKELAGDGFYGDHNYKVASNNVSTSISDNDEICHLSPGVMETRSGEFCTGRNCNPVEKSKSAINITDNISLNVAKEQYVKKDAFPFDYMSLDQTIIPHEWGCEENNEDDTLLSSPPVVSSGSVKNICAVPGQTKGASRKDVSDRSSQISCSTRKICSDESQVKEMNSHEENELKRRNKHKIRTGKKRKDSDNREMNKDFVKQERNSGDKDFEIEPNDTVEPPSKLDFDCSETCTSPGVACTTTYKKKEQKNKDGRYFTECKEPFFSLVRKDSKGHVIALSTKISSTTRQKGSSTVYKEMVPHVAKDDPNVAEGHFPLASLNDDEEEAGLGLSDKERSISPGSPSTVTPRGKAQTTDGDNDDGREAELSPRRRNPDELCFVLSPKKGSDTSETSNISPPSPSVVAAIKLDIRKKRRSVDNFEKVVESTPKHRNSKSMPIRPVLSCKNDSMSNALSHEPTANFSPILNDACQDHLCSTNQILDKRVQDENKISRGRDDGIQSRSNNVDSQDTGNQKRETKERKVKETDQSKESRLVVSAVIPEVLDKAFAQLGLLKYSGSNDTIDNDARPAMETLSPASVIPKTPARHRGKDFSRLKNRISISGAKLRRKSCEWKASESVRNADCSLVDLDSTRDEIQKGKQHECTSNAVKNLLKPALGNVDYKPKLVCDDCTVVEKDCPMEEVCIMSQKARVKNECNKMNLNATDRGCSKSKQDRDFVKKNGSEARLGKKLDGSSQECIQRLVDKGIRSDSVDVKMIQKSDSNARIEHNATTDSIASSKESGDVKIYSGMMGKSKSYGTRSGRGKRPSKHSLLACESVRERGVTDGIDLACNEDIVMPRNQANNDESRHRSVSPCVYTDDMSSCKGSKSNENCKNRFEDAVQIEYVKTTDLGTEIQCCKKNEEHSECNDLCKISNAGSSEGRVKEGVSSKNILEADKDQNIMFDKAAHGEMRVSCSKVDNERNDGVQINAVNDNDDFKSIIKEDKVEELQNSKENKHEKLHHRSCSENLNNIFDMENLTELPCEDLEELTGSKRNSLDGREANVNLSKSIIGVDAMISKEVNLVDQSIKSDVCHNTRLCQFQNDKETMNNKASNIADTSMDILDHLMFGKTASEPFALTISLTEGSKQIAGENTMIEQEKSKTSSIVSGYGSEELNDKKPRNEELKRSNFDNEVEGCEINGFRNTLKKPFKITDESLTSGKCHLPEADVNVKCQNCGNGTDVKKLCVEIGDALLEPNVNRGIDGDEKGLSSTIDMAENHNNMIALETLTDVNSGRDDLHVSISDSLLTCNDNESAETSQQELEPLALKDQFLSWDHKTSETDALVIYDQVLSSNKKMNVEPGSGKSEFSNPDALNEEDLSHFVDSSFDIDEFTQLCEDKKPTELSATRYPLEALETFKGFSTASGKKVNVSEKALDAARKKLEADNGHTKEVEKAPTFKGFSTASGKKVNVSEKALDAARKKLEVDDGHTKGVENAPTFKGFSTASGKKVNVPEKALDAAWKKLEADNGHTKEVEKAPTFKGFSTASGKKVNVSEKALDAARKKLEADNGHTKEVEKAPTFKGFSTASGKKVNVPEKALDAAWKKLEADNGHTKEVEKAPTFKGFSSASGKKVNVSEKALDAARKKLEADNGHTKEVEKAPTFKGFSTASGKIVDISKKALDAARKKLEADDGHTKEVEKAPTFKGFSTASGKKVNVSEKALDAARKKLEADDGHSKEVEKAPTFKGFSTASGKKVDVSEKALDAARKKLEADDGHTKEVEKAPTFKGFSTASGKRVDVSKKALNAARQKLEADTMEVEVLGFETSSGRKVDISESALDDAKTKLEAEKEDQIGSISADSPSKEFLEQQTLNLFEKDSSRRRKDAMVFHDFVTSNKPCDDILSDGAVYVDDYFIEMSERFDQDIERAIENNPMLLEEDPRQGKVLLGHGNDKHSKRKVVTEDRDENINETGNQDTPLVVKRRKSLGMSRKNSFNFKGRSSNPSEYHSDRDAKHTIPLIPKISRIQDFKSPNILRSGLARPASLPRLPSTESKSTPLSDSKSKKGRMSATKSFSTPFKPSSNKGREAESQCVTGGKLKRPLLACVPFGKRLRLDDVEEPGNAADEVRLKPGRLYRLKNQTKRPRLSQLTNGQQPTDYTREELQDCGLEEGVINVCSDNAKNFVFTKDSFSDCALQKGVTIVGDGAKLNLTNEGCAGLPEFEEAFMSLAGVDKSLINGSWFANQYLWVVWKLASMEKSFPYLFAGRCLTPSELMFQLKYRYDKEIDHANRSAIKKILERDDISTSRLVLCVSKILPPVHLPDNKETLEKEAIAKDANAKVIIELTDGWYPIKAILDKPLSSFVQLRKIKVGQKLCIYGANLIGSEQAVPPLEAPDSVMLELSANSTRRAHWDAKLGFQASRRAFSVPIYSLFPDGGLVGCLDVVITRIYPQQYMEKSSTGCVFRNAVQESRACKRYTDEKHKKMEKIYQKIQNEFEKSTSTRDKRKARRRSNTPSAKEISEIMNGKELFEIVESAHDPGSFEMMLNDRQQEMLSQFRLQKEDEQRTMMQKKFDKAWREVQEDFPERLVLPLQKFRVVDFKCADRNKNSDTYLTVWKPTEDMTNSLKEGQRIKIYNVTASASRYKHCSSSVQLATMKSTRYEVKTADAHIISDVYQPREVTTFNLLKLHQKHLSNEIDVVGYVIYIENQGSHSELQTVYLDDATGVFLGVKVWGGLKAFHLEDIMKPGSLICFKNLIFKTDSFPASLVTATFTDLSAAYSNPKELFLKEAASELQNKIGDLPSYLNDRKEALQEKIRYGSRGVKMSGTPKSSHTRYATTPSNNSAIISSTTSALSRFGEDPNMLAPGKDNPPTPCPPESKSALCEAILSTPLKSNSEVEESQERQAQLRLNEKKRKALTRYGEASSLSPLTVVATPKTKREFKPPSMRKNT